MGYSTFNMITISPERREDYYNEEIEECMSIVNSNESQLSVKDAQTKIKKLRTKLESLEYATARDSVVYFEELGIDALFVDEAHNFKNLSINTKLSRIAGISTTASNRSEDMYMKIKYISELNGGDKGIVFATGTPLSNSLTEMYTMQKYLQPSYLASKGQQHFDSWISDFGEITTSIELAPTGNSFRAKTRCNSFKNVPELMKMFKRCTDVQTAEMLDLPIPTLKNNQYTLCILEPSEKQQDFITECGDRAENIHNGIVDPKEDNMLKVTNDGKMCALDMRLVDPSAEDEENSKVNVCIRNVFKKYNDTNDDKLTQVIFLDKSTPSNTFNLYDDIRDKLVKMGISKDEIAFIHEAKTDIQKQNMFDEVNKGSIRIIIGSTEKMGAGTNIQTKLCALHHLDVPWRPSDIEQREGRILRRGNTCSEVEIFRYATEKTFDSYSWQTIENKQKFISQVITDKPLGRSINDIDEQALNYAEIKSLATGDPRIKEQLELSLAVSMLKSRKGQFESEKIETRKRIAFEYPKEIHNIELLLEKQEKDLDTILKNPVVIDDKFSVKIKGTTFSNREDAGKMIISLKKELDISGKFLCTYRGFNIILTQQTYEQDYMIPQFTLSIQGVSEYSTKIGTEYKAVFANIDNALDAEIPQLNAETRQKLNYVQRDLEIAQDTVNTVFPQEEELFEKSARLSKLTADLGLNSTKEERMSGIVTEQNESNDTLDLTSSNGRN